jgi:anti-anti-sigma regulatory factor
MAPAPRDLGHSCETQRRLKADALLDRRQPASIEGRRAMNATTDAKAATPKAATPKAATPKARTPTMFQSWRSNGWTVVSVSGDLDAIGVRELERQFASAAANGVFVAVELSRATVLDAALDDVLAAMEQLLTAFGGRLTVLGRRASTVQITPALSESGGSRSS